MSAWGCLWGHQKKLLPFNDWDKWYIRNKFLWVTFEFQYTFKILNQGTGRASRKFESCAVQFSSLTPQTRALRITDQPLGNCELSPLFIGPLLSPPSPLLCFQPQHTESSSPLGLKSLPHTSHAGWGDFSHPRPLAWLPDGAWFQRCSLDLGEAEPGALSALIDAAVLASDDRSSSFTGLPPKTWAKKERQMGKAGGPEDS